MIRGIIKWVMGKGMVRYGIAWVMGMVNPPPIRGGYLPYLTHYPILLKIIRK